MNQKQIWQNESEIVYVEHSWKYPTKEKLLKSSAGRIVGDVVWDVTIFKGQFYKDRYHREQARHKWWQMSQRMRRSQRCTRKHLWTPKWPPRSQIQWVSVFNLELGPHYHLWCRRTGGHLEPSFRQAFIKARKGISSLLHNWVGNYYGL
jgi:hypothetical protein